MNKRSWEFGAALRRILLVLCAVAVGATAHSQSLPPKKPQPTPVFLSKDGGIVSGRQAIGEMFTKALQPPAKGGQCGMKLIPEKTIVVGNTVNVIWRCEAPFFAEPYCGSEAFETRNGLLAAQVTTWDPSAIKMKK